MMSTTTSHLLSGLIPVPSPCVTPEQREERSALLRYYVDAACCIKAAEVVRDYLHHRDVVRERQERQARGDLHRTVYTYLASHPRYAATLRSYDNNDDNNCTRSEVLLRTAGFDRHHPPSDDATMTGTTCTRPPPPPTTTCFRSFAEDDDKRREAVREYLWDYRAICAEANRKRTAEDASDVRRGREKPRRTDGKKKNRRN